MIMRVIVFPLVSFVLSLFFVKLTIIISNKKKWYDNIDARKIHTGSIPRLGGLGLFLSFFIILALYCFISNSWNLKALPFVLGGFCIWISGIVDDFKNLPARVKFLIQLVCITLSVIFSPFYLDKIFFIELPEFLGKLITFLWIIYLVNAFNLIDGIDWLCSGISFLSIATLVVVFILNGVNPIPCAILAASILGFMYFNKPNAKIFLGDGGSQTLGYCIAVIPLFLNDGAALKYNKVLIMILLAIIPASDVISAIIRRLRDHRSIFSTDRAHIHHKLLNIGFSKVVAMSYLLGIQFIVSIAIICCQFGRDISTLIVLLLVTMFVEVFFITVHYVNRAVNRRLKGHLSENAQEEH